MKLQVKTDQTETDKLIMTLYGRFHRVRSNVLKLISELGLRAREPLAAQVVSKPLSGLKSITVSNCICSKLPR